MTGGKATAISCGALIAGASLVVLGALPYKVFDLDRYFVPKELILHGTALIAVVAALTALKLSAATRGSRPDGMPLTRTDTLLVSFLALSTASAMLATNHWVAERSLAISASGLGVFWAAQSVAAAGRGSMLMVGLAVSVALAAAVSLLQAYGVETEFFSLNRSPGGTLGNRNFVAHVAAIGLPTLLVVTLRARRALGVLMGALATAMVATAIVLSRSRAAWVATAIAAVTAVPIVLRARRQTYRPGRSPAGPRHGAPGNESIAGNLSGHVLALRSTLVGAAAVAGVCTAIILPNTLNWRSQSPYLDSVLGVTNFRGGSGRGRLVQYTNTVKLALMHPVLGVGPGNWAIAYPRVASHNDPSLDPDDGMTANPWPSSDWAALLSERGVLGTLCIGLAFVGLFVTAWRTADAAVDSGRLDRLLLALALFTTGIALVVVGMFDAVLLLPAPTLLGWCMIGVFSGLVTPQPPTRLTLPSEVRGVLVAAAVAVYGLAAARSLAQVAAMALYTSGSASPISDTELEWAARLDPGSYRIRMKLAESLTDQGACTRARSQAIAARALYPSAPEPRRVLNACGPAR